MAYLYLITNTVTGMRYVGITTKTVEYRWRGHVCGSRGRNRRPSPLCLAIREHGAAAFKVETLFESTDWATLCQLERDAIRERGTRAPNGYNVAVGGGRQPRGKSEANRVAALQVHARRRRRKVLRQQMRLRLLAEMAAAGVSMSVSAWRRQKKAVPAE